MPRAHFPSLPFAARGFASSFQLSALSSQPYRIGNAHLHEANMNFTTLEEAAAFTGKLLYRKCSALHHDALQPNLKRRDPTRAEALEALSWLLGEPAIDALDALDSLDQPSRVEAELAFYHSHEQMPAENDFLEGNRNPRYRKEIRAVRDLCAASTRLIADALGAVLDLQCRLLAADEDPDTAASPAVPDDFEFDLVNLTGYVREIIDQWKPTVDRREFNGHTPGPMGRRRARAAHLRWCGRIFAVVCTMVWPRDAGEWCSEIRSVFDQDLEQFATTFVMDGQPTYRRIELNPHQFPEIKKYLVVMIETRRRRGNTQKG